jgi:NAD(P)-dependent dehydrogenase (short-subunit alcohol dehydrogenase family)
MELSGRVALVTGGATGLGRAIAIALARAGARVAITWSTSAAAAAETERELNALADAAIAIQADVAWWDQTRAAVARATALLGPPTILVNNAGTTRYVPAADLAAVTEADWERIMRVNVAGAFGAVQAVADGMASMGGGVILNVASNSAFSAEGSSIPYVASKAALVSLTHALARTLGPVIRVNAVAPGWMDTPWLERNLPAERRAAVRDDPMGPVDVARVTDAALLLITSDAITGQVLVVDKGELAGVRVPAPVPSEQEG